MRLWKFCVPKLNELYQQSIQEQYENVPDQSGDGHQIHRVWYLCLFLLYLGLGFYNPSVNLIVFPFVFSVSTMLYFFHQQQCKAGNIDPLICRFPDLARAFLQSFFSGVLIVFAVGQIVQLGFATVFGQFGRISKDYKHSQWVKSEDTSEHSHDNKDVSNGWNHVYFFCSAFIFAAMIEEGSKAFILQHSTKLYLKHPSKMTMRFVSTYVCIGGAIGLGMGTSEGILYTCVYSRGLGAQLMNLVIRVISGIPGHTCYGILWGIGYAKKQLLEQPMDQPFQNHNTTLLSWIKIGLLPWFFHGFFDYFLMETELLSAKYSWLGKLSVLFLLWDGLTIGFVYWYFQRFMKEVWNREKQLNTMDPHQTTTVNVTVGNVNSDELDDTLTHQVEMH